MGLECNERVLWRMAPGIPVPRCMHHRDGTDFWRTASLSRQPLRRSSPGCIKPLCISSGPCQMCHHDRDYTESQNYTQTYYRRAGRTVAHHDRYMRRMRYQRARFLTALADSHEAARVWGLEPVVEERALFGSPTILGSKHRLQTMMNSDVRILATHT